MNQSQPMIPEVEDDEITLRDLIEKVVDYGKEIWSKKWWIIAFTIPFVLYFGYKAHTFKVTYKAALTYTLSDGSGGGAGLAGILGSFGLGKGGKVNLDKIVELSKSRNIIQRVLFTKIALDTFDNKDDYIANHLIVLYELDKAWSKNNPEYSDFKFSNDSIKSFSHKELNALKMVYGLVVGSENNKNPIFSNGFNEDTGILTLSADTRDEELSIQFCNLVFTALKKYYMLSSTKGSQSTFKFVEQKTDSIFELMKSREYQLSRFNDSHRNLADPNLLTEKKLLETEILKLKTMYAEATKNRELADFSLTAGTPDITIIDEPLPPLDPITQSFIMALIKGGLLGGLLGCCIVTGRKIFVDALSN